MARATFPVLGMRNRATIRLDIWVLLTLLLVLCFHGCAHNADGGSGCDGRNLSLPLKELKAQHFRGSSSPGSAAELEPGKPISFYVFADERRNDSGVALKKDQQYRFRIEQGNCWKDASISAHPIKGWGDHPFPWWVQLVRTFGRIWSASPDHDLMVLLGGIEGTNVTFAFVDHVVMEDSGEQMILGELRAQETGELVAFANDVQMDYFYENNSGYVIVTVEVVPGDPSTLRQ